MAGIATKPTLGFYIRRKMGTMLLVIMLKHMHSSKLPKKRSDITIYVARIRKDGSQGYSKPCKHCTDILLSEGVSPENIWYTTDDGMWTNLIGQNKEL